jgi:hypothetical protein
MKPGLSLTIIALLLSCTACTLHLKNTLRYRSVAIIDNDPSAGKTAKVSAFVLDIPETAAGKTVADLPERAQPQALAILGEKTLNTKDYLAVIGAPIGKGKERGGAEDGSVFQEASRPCDREPGNHHPCRSVYVR